MEPLFLQLQAAGFRMDTARKLRLLAIFEKKAGEHIGNISELKYQLAPFVAGSPAEQQRFYEIFDRFCAECAAEAEAWAEGEAPISLQVEDRPPKKSYWKRYVWWFLALLPIFAIFAWKQCHQPPAEATPKLEFENGFRVATEGSLYGAKVFDDLKRDSNECFWELSDAKTGLVEHRDTGLYFAWKAQDYGEDKCIVARAAGYLPSDTLRVHVDCANPPEMPEWKAPRSPLRSGVSYRFTASKPKEKNARVRWVFNEKDTINGLVADYAFKEEGVARVNCTAYFNDKDCYESQTESLQVGNDKALLPLAELKYAPPTRVMDYQFWVWLLLALPLLLSAWFAWKWWKKRREKPVFKSDAELEAEHPIHDKAPYFIPYQPQDGKISTPPDFFRMADVLRRREDSERRNLDIPASVRATVDGGGFPVLLDKRESRPPEYLFLVERKSEQDQQGRLFERLCTFLQKQDAPVTAYFHDGNFFAFWNHDNPEGCSLDQLQKQYAGYRLVLIGTGHGLVNPYNVREPALHKDLLKALLFWKKALFLSTLPVSGWYAPEALLHRHFLLFLADTAGIRAGLEALDALDEHEPGPYQKWEDELGRRRWDKNPRFALWENVEQHEAFLAAPPEEAEKQKVSLFRWLAALAVSVRPDYALTIAIGKKIGAEISHDNLLRLSRIPWLSENEPDQNLRLAFLSRLSAEEEGLAREAAEAELEAVKQSVAGGFAELEWKTNLAIHRFALDPNDAEHRQTLRELLRLGLFSDSQLMELDAFVQRRISPEARNSGQTGEAIQKHLNAPEPKPFFTRNFGWALFFLALTLLTGNFLYWLKVQWSDKPERSFMFKEEMTLDSASVWNNAAVRMAKGAQQETKYMDWDKKWQDSAVLADQYLLRAMAAKPLSGVIDSNRLRLRYNMAAQLLNFALLDSAGTYQMELADREFRNLLNFPIDAQEEVASVESGEELFIANCASCHNKNMKDNLNGPALGAVEDRWAAYPRKDLYSFIRNSQAMIKAGHPKAAALWKRYQPVMMNSFPAITDEQIESILKYIRAQEGKIGGQQNFATHIVAQAPFYAKNAEVSTLLNARHGHGLCQFYMYKDAGNTALLDSAKATYQEILAINSGYFDTLRVAHPVNLETLLAGEKAIKPIQYYIRVLVLDKESGEAIQRAFLELESNSNSNSNSDRSGLVTLSLEKPELSAVPVLIEAAGYKSWAGKVLGHSDSQLDTVILSRHKADGDRDEDGVSDQEDICPDIKGLQSKHGCPVASNLQNIFETIDRGMISITGGRFLMGGTSRDKDAFPWEFPAHFVSLSSYKISRNEVTVEQYLAFCDDTRSHYPQWLEPGSRYHIETGTQEEYKAVGMTRENKGYPISGISWYDAQSFCNWLNYKTGKKYRLPTEAEWEFAARGGIEGVNNFGNMNLYAGSRNVSEVAWYKGNSDGRVHAIMCLKPNELGLFDMCGNVWEWCSDIFSQYQVGELTNPKGPERESRNAEKGDRRIYRGGGWNSEQIGCRVTYRIDNAPIYRSAGLGVRLAQ